MGATPLAGADLSTGPSPLAVRRAADSAHAASDCFSGTPDRTFDIVAINLTIVYNNFGDHDPFGRMYVLADQEQAVRAAVNANPRKPSELVQPLVVRAHVGDCIDVKFTNKIADAGPLPNLVAQGLEETAIAPIIRDFVFFIHDPGVDPNVIRPLTPLAPDTPPVERASLHIHKALTAVTSQGAMVGNNPDSTVGPGESITYRWYIPDVPGAEGSYLFHSHADARYQSAHGLFGALIAEPRGSSWLDPVTGGPLASGWEAMVVQPPGPGKPADFREAVTLFHDQIEPCFSHSLPRTCLALPIADDNRFSAAYGPGTKGINYRSEPFMNRFKYVANLTENGVLPTYGNTSDFDNAKFDESQAYGSYGYGDPATPIARAYVGDPTKFRLVHGGPGQHHVFHLHGGGDRWRYQPDTDDTQFDDGKIKSGNVEQSPSERLDVQNVGPGEAFNLEIEGGAGGVQQSVGDFLYHCHIVEHYVAGMWGMWRVYDTLQDGTNPNFHRQAPLQPLPDRAPPPRAVNSLDLVGTHTFPGTAAEKLLVAGPTDLGASPPEINVNEWIQAFLPAKGVPRHDDASVWDWTTITSGGLPLYLGEPETTFTWPNYSPQTDGLWTLDPAQPGRPELQFHPDNGRPAYPMLHPHLGKRPPFAPDHGPTPYLGLEFEEQNPLGLCVQDPRRTSRHYNIVAYPTPVRYNTRDVDRMGEIFLHAEDIPAVQANPALAESLVLRANVHDCVDITFSSLLEDDLLHQHHAKVNMHIHLVQFDVQASDGVITGNNFEQSVRSVRSGREVTSLAAPAAAGATSIQVEDITVFLDATGAPKLGSRVGIDLATPDHEEARVQAVDVPTKTVTLDRALQDGHAAGDRVGYEFVHYRWYPDVELGMVYWHDHVAGLKSWTHGLFGGLVVEPALSTWTNPVTGAPLRDGTSATAGTGYHDPHTVDIRVPGEPDYREFVAQIQDRPCVPNEGPCGGFNALPNHSSSFNLRTAPWNLRRPANADPAYMFSSVVHGDAATDTVRAYEGDRTVVRLLYAGQSSSRGVETFSVSGHRFALERHQPVPHTIAALSLGISSQHNLELECGAGSGYQAVPGDPASCTGWHAGDFLYRLNGPDRLAGGAWGILRVHDKRNTTLLPLPDAPLPAGPADSGFPNNVQPRDDHLLGVGPLPDPLNLLGPTPAPPAHSGDVGPPGAPVRHFDVAAITLPVAYNADGLVKANAAFFARIEDVPALASGALQPEPLVIRANEGEVIEVSLTNLLGLSPVQLASFNLIGVNPDVLFNLIASLPSQRGSTASWERVSLAPSLLSVDPLGSGGITVGYNPDMAVPPGGTHTSRWYADRPLGAALLLDMSQPVDNFHAPAENTFPPISPLSHVQPSTFGVVDEQNAQAHLERGLYGMVVIEPAGSTYEDPATGEPLLAGADAVIRSPGGDFREVALLLETHDNQFESSTMPYDPNVVGFTGANYRSEPWGSRLGVIGIHDCNFNTDNCVSMGFTGVRNPAVHTAPSSVPHGDPATPILEAFANEPVMFRVATASGSQLHTFAIEGHAWRLEPDQPTSNLIDVVTVGPGEAANIPILAGGGLKTAADAKGDYLWLDHRGGFEEAGLWGLLRVHDPADPLLVTLIEPL